MRWCSGRIGTPWPLISKINGVNILAYVVVCGEFFFDCFNYIIDEKSIVLFSYKKVDILSSRTVLHIVGNI